MNSGIPNSAILTEPQRDTVDAYSIIKRYAGSRPGSRLSQANNDFEIFWKIAELN